jgi:hypothetical protein
MMHGQTQIKITRRIRWAEHVALVGDKRSTYRVLVWKLREEDHLVDVA